MNVYDFKAKTSRGEEKSLADYKGKVLIIVNTASAVSLPSSRNCRICI